MKNLSASYDTKFICIRQPLRVFHDKEKEFESDYSKYLRAFYGLIDKNIDTTQINYKDFGSIFNNIENLKLDEVFLDEVHLYDKGNQILSTEILKLLQ